MWTINAPLLEEAFDTLYRRLGIRPPAEAGPALARFRGRAALNLSRLKAAARRMPGGSDQEVERQYLGRALTISELPPGGLHSRLSRVAPALRALRLRGRLLEEAEAFRAALQLALSIAPDHRQMSDHELLEYRRRVRDLARYGMRTQVGTAAAAAASYRGLEIALERWLRGAGGPSAAQRLTAGSVGTQATGCAVVVALWEAHCAHCLRPEVAPAVYEGALASIEDRLGGLQEGRECLREVDEGLRRAGCLAVYSGATWEEEREAFWSALRQCQPLAREEGPPAWADRAARGAREELEQIEHRLRRSWRWWATRVLTGQVVDVRRRLLRRLVADAGEFLRLRETVKSDLLRLGGEERRIVLELAARAVRRGLLGREGDEQLLSDSELDRLFEAGEGPDLVEIERRRSAFGVYAEAPPLPEVFSGLPPREATADAEEAGGVLRGRPASPGRASGPARVVHSLSDARLVQPGEILIGHSTDPSWTPIFLICGGIVMEEGGPLSHAAIVAREFGRPAVLGVRGATRRIPPCSRVLVDGTVGSVEVIDAGEAEDFESP